MPIGLVVNSCGGVLRGLCLLYLIPEVISEAAKYVLDALAHGTAAARRVHVEVLIAQTRKFPDVSAEFLVRLPDEMRDMKVWIVLPEGASAPDEITMVRPEMPDPHA